MMQFSSSPLVIADREFQSRLLVGTGKFSSNTIMQDALRESGTEIVTVALRRANLSGNHDRFANILDFIDPKQYLLLPNTSGAMNAEEAVRLARLAASAGLPKWVKLEIHPDPHYLLPDPIETLRAAEQLVKEGFTVLPYTSDDPVWPSAAGGRYCHGRATRFTDWKQSRDSYCDQIRIILDRQPFSNRRCRLRSAKPRRRSAGTGGGRRSGQHRHCHCRGSSSHGFRLPPSGRSWSHCFRDRDCPHP